MDKWIRSLQRKTPQKASLVKENILRAPDYFDYHPDFHSVVISPKPKAQILQTPKSQIDYLHFKEGEWQISQDPSDYSWAKLLVDFLKTYEGRPWIIINGDTDILKYIIYDRETQKSLNGKRIAVYLFEPLHLVRISKPRHQWLSDSLYDTDFTSRELDSLIEFNQNNGGNIKFDVYSCDHLLSQCLKNHPKYSVFRTRTLDSFLLLESLFRGHYPTVPWQTYDIEKRAICLNFRYEPFREMLAAYLSAMGYDQNTFLSYFHTHVDSFFRGRMTSDFDSWPESQFVLDAIKQFQTKLPLVVETKSSVAIDPSQAIPDLIAGKNVRDRRLIGSYYRKAFCGIAAETRFFVPFPNISEKKADNFSAMRPVIIVGAPNNWKYLKSIGFLSYENFFDESYDNEPDHFKRLSKIFRLIDWVFSLTDKQALDLLHEMHATLRFNYHHFHFALPKFYQRKIREEGGLGPQVSFDSM